jgi:chemotaxis protein CheD
MVSVLPSSTASSEAISVEMAEIKVSTKLTDNLVAYGLGACVAVCLYDPILHVAGMAHVVLPDHQASLSSSKGRTELPPGKFGDTAVPALIEEICKNGGKRENIRAAIAGGAHIFGEIGKNSATASRLEIGDRNAKSVAETLEKLEIAVIASDVGGCHGRTVTFKVCDGTVRVRPIGREEVLLAALGKQPEPAKAEQEAKAA